MDSGSLINNACDRRKEKYMHWYNAVSRGSIQAVQLLQRKGALTGNHGVCDMKLSQYTIKIAILSPVAVAEAVPHSPTSHLDV